MSEFEDDDIAPTFLQKAAQVLGDTSSALTGSKIVDAFNAYGEMWNVRVPYPEYPGWEAQSKRQAIYESLRHFSPSQQFQIIEELCEHPTFSSSGPSAPKRKTLKLELYTKYSRLRPQAEAKELDLPLVEETKHWLQGFPDSLNLYTEAKLKYDHGSFQRNVLDDLRLSLEILLKNILGNAKTLENQLPEIGGFLKARGASPQIANMFHKLLEYYTKYQNDYVKHDDAIKEEEVEFVFEMTSSLMKHFIRMSMVD